MMSVLMEFAIFPTDKGESVSPYVSRVVKMIDKSGYPYRLTPMGTVVEADTMEEILSLIDKSYKLLEPDCKRVYSAIKLDIRQGAHNCLEAKVQAVEKQIGKVSK